jgi:hypothetical protein
VEPNQHVLVSGHSDEGAFVARFDLRGQFDPSFGSSKDGRVVVRNCAAFRSIYLLPNGYITVRR